jgi:hypothetical protein
MKRLCLTTAIGLIALGAAGAAVAQPYAIPQSGPALSYRIIRVIPNPPQSQSDTRRNSVDADPSCGAANPQGGIPTATTWGECP